MLPYKQKFLISIIGLLSILLLSGNAAHALLVTHSEAHVSNIQITPVSGSIDFFFNPWLAVTAASAFDDLSGFDQDYDDDPDMDGEAAASAATLHVSESSAASSNNMTIDVVSDVNVPTGDTFFAASGFGELYNVFMITEMAPVDVTFSLDYTAELSGQADALGSFEIDYGISMVISDGITDFTLDAFNVLSGSGKITDSGTLLDTFILQPFTLYSIDIVADPNTVPKPIPEPTTIILLGAGLAGLVVLRRRRNRNQS